MVTLRDEILERKMKFPLSKMIAKNLFWQIRTNSQRQYEFILTDFYKDDTLSFLDLLTDFCHLTMEYTSPSPPPHAVKSYIYKLELADLLQISTGSVTWKWNMLCP